MDDCDPDPHSVDLPCTPNLRRNPHPISQDPRLVPYQEQGYRPERNLQNSHNFAAHIPRLYSGMSAIDGANEDVRMKCCCGRSDCAYLEHNNAALGGLEKDLETAARLGQALLSRHESYINESQAERARLSTHISELEAERLSLQNANEKIVAENRDLLHQLEHLNVNLAESDRDVKRLEDLLLECEMEVKRLNGLVRRTEELDGRVQEMERERHLLNEQLEDGQEERQSTLARWRESERKVRELEEDVRRIEQEAQLDREKQAEIIARLEKERAHERELGGAEGRLKGAAAMQSINKNESGSKNVVSHFVRDILQDNANLQAGIAELRQLLQSSNEEVQNLREQIMMHQPMNEEDGFGESRRSVSLDHDLQSAADSSKQVQQEVHVHHHYHAKLAKARNPTIRKSNKRKAIMPGQSVHSDSSAPSTPVSRPQRHNSSPVIPLSLYQPQSQKNRWSMQSTATMSSVLSSIPSSPRSYFDRGGSIFDRLEQGEESSRPTSPESVADMLSPGLGQWRFKKEGLGLDACEEEDLKESFDMSPLVESKPCFDVNELPTPLDTPFDTPPELEHLEAEKELTPKPSIMLQKKTSEADLSMTPKPKSRSTEEDTVVSVGGQLASLESPSPSVREPLTPVERAMPLFEEPKKDRNPSKTILEIIPEMRPSLNRKGSHETLVSISGMDIHLAQRGSSAATLELLHSHFAHSPAQTRKVSAVQPLASVTEYTAVSTPLSMGQQAPIKDSDHIPSSIEALSGIALPKTRAARQASQIGPISRLGGWVRGRWGVAPIKSVGNLRSAYLGQDTVSVNSSTSSQTGASRDNSVDHISSKSAEERPTNTRSISVPVQSKPNPLHAKVDPAILFAGRSPGINQPGFIPGFRSAVMNRRTPSQVMVSVIDEEGLREGLNE